MFHTTLSRVNTLHKGESIVIKSPGKGQDKRNIVENPSERDRK